MFRFIILLAALASLVSSAKPPKSWKICKKSDTNLNECNKVAIDNALSGLVKNGSPQFGVGKLDPMRFNSLDISQGTGAVAVQLGFKNLDIIGLSSKVINKVKVDWDKYRIEVDATFKDNVILDGDYTIKGKVLVLPIVGNGKCNLTFDGLSGKVTIIGHEVLKNKQKYFNVDKFDLKLKSRSSYYSLSNLFNGDKALGDNMNVFLNENSAEIFNELEPSISSGLAAGFKSVTKQFFDKIPVNLLSPQ